MNEVLETPVYLQKILQKEFDERITFVVPASMGPTVIGRVRTFMTRIKNRMKAENKQILHFKIRTEIKYGEPAGCDTITFWKTLSMKGSRTMDISALTKIMDDLKNSAEVKQGEMKLS